MADRAIFGIYGASGCGRGIMPLAREQLQCLGLSREQLVFIDDNPQAPQINGQRILRYAEFLACSVKEYHVALAISNSAIREKLAQQCIQDGILPWTVQAGNVVIMDEVRIGEGALLSPFVTLASNIQIGRYFHANLYSYVEHDCIIGNYVTFAPGVHCNGNIVIGDHVYIGAGAIIKQGRPGQPLVIGHHAVVGMGAVVTGDVPPETTVVGNPARPMQKD